MILQGSQEEMAEKAASLIFEKTLLLLKTRQQVVIAVPGGSSVAGVYRKLSQHPLPWEKIHFFLLDERLVPVDHPDSNYKLIKENMGKGVPPEMIHPFDSSTEPAELALAEYNKELESCGGRFDIVLASSGEDGHIASLFPGHPLLKEKTKGFALVIDSPKPPKKRMTASPGLIESADSGIILFFGRAKANALHQFFNGELSVSDCPAKIITRLPHYFLLTDQEV